MTETFDKQLIIFLEKLQELFGTGITVYTNKGKKYIKVLRNTSGQRSAYCFVEMATGDIFKAATWSTPAKHARGNIYNENPIQGCNEYSVDYLR